MWSVIVCDGDETEREQLLEYIRRFSGEKIWEVTLTAAPTGRNFMRNWDRRSRM